MMVAHASKNMKKGCLFIAGETGVVTRNICVVALQKARTRALADPARPLLDTYPKDFILLQRHLLIYVHCCQEISLDVQQLIDE